MVSCDFATGLEMKGVGLYFVLTYSVFLENGILEKSWRFLTIIGFDMLFRKFEIKFLIKQKNIAKTSCNSDSFMV